jgi:hypothetical protein
MASAQQCFPCTRTREKGWRSVEATLAPPGKDEDMSQTRLEHLAGGREEVERMMRAGESFSSVETMIDEARLTEEEKAALWLFAWSMRDKRAQQRETRGLLAYLSSIPRDFARTAF